MMQQADSDLIMQLGRLLASEYSLYTKIWSFHWNLVGTDFAERHGLYGDWKDSLGEDIDVLAERIRQLGESCPSGLNDFAELSIISDTPPELINEADSAKELYADFCALDSLFQEGINIAEESDKITSNILQELGAHVQKTKWFLSSICH